ncbi:MAG: heme-binding protein [Betaproteobacteria bacterium]|nr:heme-binding protein [Betaproteobacteria bacterium]
MKKLALGTMLAAASGALAGPAAAAEDATYTVKLMTPETALAAAQAALKQCRALGFQVTVAVVDRGGTAQVVLRDRFAGPHTVRTAIGKAWTAASFRTDTSELVDLTQPGKPQSGVRQLKSVVVLGGGVQVQSGGTLVGAIGVSGAPGGAEDERCAKAGLEAVRAALEL